MPPAEALPSCELGSADVSVATVVVDLEPSGERHRPDRDGPADRRCRNEREETTKRDPANDVADSSVIALAS